MPLCIYVDAYSGYCANEKPRQFCLDDDVFEIEEVEDRWYDPNAEYFKVRTVDGAGRSREPRSVFGIPKVVGGVLIPTINVQRWLFDQTVGGKSG
jgi:hypothetical protein